MKIWHLMVGLFLAIIIIANIKAVLTLVAILAVVIMVLVLVVLCGAIVWLIDKVFFNG
ncbi:hypothetical protein HYP93_gp13 [Stenotrophomonas phage Pokken]|uniref:Uncharacterized protein n=1 Tax=Stenotrophomonas phage Pokken TaxID=2596674 RepID=A0A5B9N9E9_9CAUD|nr:hypothetical protein HYP93_gp13 [Stenotrophomonas phage Pokken]QEG09236.1 hypothetical protein CPT_Pokken_013 [Stenotrophomonas phage Pokken]